MKTPRKVIELKFKAIIAFALMLSMLMASPLQAYAEKNLELVTTLNFNDVKPLMMSRNQAILNNVAAYNTANSAQGSIQTGTTDINSLMVTLSGISSADPAVNNLRAVLAALLQAQSSIAVAQNSLSQSTDIVGVGLQTEQANYSIVWGIESMYLTYNSLNYQIATMEAKVPLLQNQFKVSKLQQKLGMCTEEAVQNAQSQLTELETGIEQLKAAQKTIKQTFNVNLAQSYDTAIQIKEVPDVTSDTISQIDPEKDYIEALKKSYTVRLNDSDTDKKNDATRSFQKGFYAAYDDMLAKQKILDSQKLKYAVADKTFKVAELKYKLSMLSLIQYQLAYSNFVSSKSDLAQAEDDLFKVYRVYQWATQGLIVNTSSQS